MHTDQISRLKHRAIHLPASKTGFVQVNKTPKRETKATRQAKQILKLKIVVGTLITWLAQSSVGCLSVSEAEMLLKDLDKE